MIDPVEKIMFRDEFQSGLLKFVATYRQDLMSSVELQSAFVRKFDALCE